MNFYVGYSEQSGATLVTYSSYTNSDSFIKSVAEKFIEDYEEFIMNNMAAMFSSKSDDWETPQELFDSLNARYNFDLDVCATADNAKCARYFTKEQDGLAQEWSGVCWMNPPYGRGIGQWMAKALEASKAGATVVCLVPARTDTAWWHDCAEQGEYYFIRGRLKFGEAVNSAPFPSAVVVFRPSRTIARR